MIKIRELERLENATKKSVIRWLYRFYCFLLCRNTLSSITRTESFMERRLLTSKARLYVCMTMGLSSLVATWQISHQENVSYSYHPISTLWDPSRKDCLRVLLLFVLLIFIFMLIPATTVFKVRLSWWIDWLKEQEFGKSKVQKD